MALSSVILYIFAFIALALAQGPLRPSVDPFYAQPDNIGTFQPGQLIRSRQISNRLNPLLPLNVNLTVERVYQFMYRTTDTLGDPVAAVTTLLIPYNANSMKLLSYQTAYDSSNADCSPSYTLQYGSAAPGGLGGLLSDNSTLSTDTPFLAASLKQGWWINVPDYEGLQAQYSTGPISGRATLDSVRVILKEAPKLGLSPQARYAMFGYSGGALASGWAAELQPGYAPELKFQGAAIGGVIPSSAAVLQTINGGSYAGLAFAGIVGITKAYPNATQWLNENLVPATKDKFFDVANSCLVGAANKGANQDVYSYFKNGQASIEEPVPASILKWGSTMGLYGVPTMPMLMFHGAKDDISPVAGVDALVSKYCQTSGTTIEYRRNLVTDHIVEAFVESANALAWVSDRLDGKTVKGGCRTIPVVGTTFSLEATLLLGQTLIGILQTVLGGRLGGT